MMLYQEGNSIDPGKLRVELHPTAGFAMIRLYPGVSLFVSDIAEADALIKAAVEAKRLLDPPVIIDSERTCPEVNRDSGAWCHRGGDHGVHEDADGETWRTDGEPRPIEDDESEWCDRSWHDGDCCPGSRAEYAARPASVKL